VEARLPCPPPSQELEEPKVVKRTPAAPAPTASSRERCSQSEPALPLSPPGCAAAAQSDISPSSGMVCMSYVVVEINLVDVGAACEPHEA
jgi:hypothetical protein